MPRPVENEAVWSGLELDGRLLVRAVPVGQTDRQVEVHRASGKVIILDAPWAGATYFIDRDDRIERVPSGRP